MLVQSRASNFSNTINYCCCSKPHRNNSDKHCRFVSHFICYKWDYTECLTENIGYMNSYFIDCIPYAVLFRLISVWSSFYYQSDKLIHFRLAIEYLCDETFVMESILSTIRTNRLCRIVHCELHQSLLIGIVIQMLSNAFKWYTTTSSGSIGKVYVLNMLFLKHYLLLE